MTAPENALIEAWDASRSTLNGGLALPNISAAEVMAHQDWDSLTITPDTASRITRPRWGC